MALTIEELRGLLAPSEDERSQAMGMGLLNFGAGITANNRGNQGRFLPALSGGMLPAAQGYQQTMQSGRANRMQDIALQLKLAEYQRKQDEEKRLADIIAGLTPEQQKAYQLGGGAAVAKSLLPEQEKVNFNQPFLPDGTPNKAYQDYQRSLKPPAEDKTLVAVIGPDGQTPVLVPRASSVGMTPASSKAASKPTEQEAKAAFYAQNMKAASATLDALEAGGFDLTKVSSQAGTALSGGMTNIFASKEAQQAKQAQNQWAEQMLRMQTGAAATQPEIDRTVKTYFPTVGDKQATVDLKRLMRQQAEGGVFQAAGRAKDRVPQSAGASGQWGIQRVK